MLLKPPKTPLLCYRIRPSRAYLQTRRALPATRQPVVIPAGTYQSHDIRATLCALILRSLPLTLYPHTSIISCLTSIPQHTTGTASKPIFNSMAYYLYFKNIRDSLSRAQWGTPLHTDTEEWLFAPYFIRPNVDLI